MPIPTITVKPYKDGRLVASFRDDQGRRVRTREGVESNWTRVEQIKQLAEYGIQLQKDQCAKGIGSDGAPMPPLKPRVQFAGRTNGKVSFIAGGKTLRNLYGPGIDGHMLDDIRINYLDDKRASYAITRRSSRIKALANEQKAPWWGWSPESVEKLQGMASELFETGVAEYLFSMGLIGASALAQANKRSFFSRKVA